MREAVVIATCDGRRCSDTWSTTPDSPPVRITMPDGTEYELDICPTHTEKLTSDWLAIARPAYKRPASGDRPAASPTSTEPSVAATRRKRVKRKKLGPGAQLRRKHPSQREKVECPVSGCNSYGTTPESISSHMRKAHPQMPADQVAHLVSELFGTRPARRVECPECGESCAVHFLSRHRFKRHGVAA